MEDIINDLMQKIRLSQQENLIDDIIDIYNGVYVDYDDYVRDKERLFNDLKRHDFYAEIPIMSKDIFEYIRSKNNGNKI